MPKAISRPIRSQLIVPKPKFDSPRPLSGSTRTDEKSVELVVLLVVAVVLALVVDFALAEPAAACAAGLEPGLGGKAGTGSG